MKNTSRKVLTAAAMAGLLSGTAVWQGCSDSAKTATASATNNSLAPGKIAPLAKMPVVHGCSGVNDCKGLGGCKTDAHACKFINECKGKGGCELTQKDIDDWTAKQKAAAKTPAP